MTVATASVCTKHQSLRDPLLLPYNDRILTYYFTDNGKYKTKGELFHLPVFLYVIAMIMYYEKTKLTKHTILTIKLFPLLNSAS